MRSRGVRPVKVYVHGVPSLLKKADDAGSLSGSVIVDEMDLLQKFGSRVGISRLINTDVDVLISTALFRPPLTEKDAACILHLVRLYNRKRSGVQQPIRPPVVTKS